MRQAGIYSGISGKSTGPHPLPLARIKKIMKRSSGEEQVKMVSVEAPIVFSKACEMFIEELTRRSWLAAVQAGKRRTLQRDDVASAVTSTDLFDFLLNLIPSSSSSSTSFSFN